LFAGSNGIIHLHDPKSTPELHDSCFFLDYMLRASALLSIDALEDVKYITPVPEIGVALNSF
jgi:hypothetical protein